MNLEFRKSLRRKKSSTVPPPSVERDANAEINLKGFLYRLEGSPLKLWKKRWCVLAQYALFVYKDEDEQKLLASVLLPGYNVRVCTSHDKVSHKNAFVAEHEQMKSFYFAADSNAAMCQWRNSMAQAATVQIAPVHEQQLNPPSQDVYDRDYGRYMTSMSCITRSPIYVNAPPKPKRVSPPSNRPKSADFFNEEPSISRLKETRPHTSMKLFDPHVHKNGPCSQPSMRPKSCLAEPVKVDREAYDGFSPANFIENRHDLYNRLPSHSQLSHPIAQPQIQYPHRLSSPSTSASSTPPFNARRFPSQPSFHNSTDCYSPPQAELSSLAYSMNSLNRAPHYRRPSTRSTNDVTDSNCRRSLRISPPKKIFHERMPSSVSNLEEIQPSKLEMFRQLPQPSFSTQSPVPRKIFDQLNGSRDLQSLQSLTDSQYSTAPPESSLPSLESNSDNSSIMPVQQFTNVPPPQLRLNMANAPKPRLSPPRYSEACLRSEFVQKMAESRASPSANGRTTPTPSSTTRKLLFDQITCSPLKTPLVEKNQQEDPYSYGREDLLKASQIFYGHKAVGVQPVANIADSNRQSNSLDISFQSSSHNSVFEHDTSRTANAPLSNTATAEPGAAPTTTMPIMSQLDRANYAILKQEIEGPKVSNVNTPLETYIKQSPPPARSVSDSVTSVGSQNSVLKNKSTPTSPPSPAKLTDEDEPRRGSVLAKLAFFEAKTSPEPPHRPKSSLSNQSNSNSILNGMSNSVTSINNNNVNLINNAMNSSFNIHLNNNFDNKTNNKPDLIDELKDNSVSSNNNTNRMLNFVSSASSEDILRTITASKHQRSLSLLEGPAPDVVPTQSPPYYYSDLSLSAQSSSRDSLREKPLASRRKLNSTSSSPPQPPLSEQQSTKKQSWSCDNLLKNQSLTLQESTQSANCLLDAEPFYENIGFGCKTSAIQGPEPQSSPAKISFLADSSTQDMKTASVDQQSSSQSSQESLPRSNSLIRSFCGLSTYDKHDSQETTPPSNQHNSDMCFGPPDLIQSALNSSGDHGDEIFAQILNSIGCPSKIEIPERYVPESDSEADSSAVERLARYHKADSIRRRIAGQSRDQANRLTVNQVIAKQAKHFSKIVAAHH